MQFGLTYKMARRFIYDYALKNQTKLPKSWDLNKAGGVDWVKGFKKRNSGLSLRKPENISIARIKGFNKAAIDEFYRNLNGIFEKRRFLPTNLLNLDETEIQTVLTVPKVYQS